MLSCVVTRHPIAQKHFFFFEIIVYAMIFPCTTTGHIDIVLVVQVGGRSSGRGGWTTGLQLQGNILSEIIERWQIFMLSLDLWRFNMQYLN